MGVGSRDQQERGDFTAWKSKGARERGDIMGAWTAWTQGNSGPSGKEPKQQQVRRDRVG